jgi:PAS domain S-box-containing protein
MLKALESVTILTDDTHQATKWLAWLREAHFIVEAVSPRQDAPPLLIADVVLVDRACVEQMPKWLQQRQTLMPDMQILCATDPEHATYMMALGANDIIRHPISQDVLINRVRRMCGAVRQSSAFSDTLQEIAAALSSTLNLDALLALLLDQIQRVMPPHDAANVVMIEDDGETLRIAHSAAYFDPDETDIAVLKKFERPLSELPNMWQMKVTQQPICLSVVRHDDDWIPMKNTEWIRSYIGAPIVVENQVIGFINLDSSIPYAFGAAQIGQLQAFAHHAGVAIQNAKLFEGMAALAADLEDRVKQRTHELQEEQSQLTAILDGIGEGVVFHNAEGMPLYINRALEKLYGYGEAEWLSGEAPVLVPPLNADEMQAHQRRVQRAVQTTGFWESEMTIEHKDGRPIDSQIRVHRAMSENNQLFGTITVYRDIRKEKELRDRQERFVAYASHELRTPITNIKTRMYLIDRQPDEAPRHLEVIDEVVNAMDQLVDGLLAISKLRTQQTQVSVEHFAVQDILQSVYRVQDADATQMGVSLEHEPQAVNVMVSGHKSQLIQVLTNLTVNALKHTQAGGRVRLRTILVDAIDESWIHSNSEIFERGFADAIPRWVGMVVSDTGTGIDPEHLPHLFQAFYRVEEHRPGTGLGLTIAAEMIRLHGGTISVQSTLGEGTTFTVWLPAEDVL